MNENDFTLKQGEKLVSQQVRLMIHSICFMLKDPDYYKEVFYLMVKVRIAECEGYITALYHVSHITDYVYDQFMDFLQMLNEELADTYFNLK